MSVDTMTTGFGERATVRWYDGSVRVTVNNEAERVAFSLTSDTALQISETPDGRWWIVYSTADGTIVQYYSDDNARTWTQL